MKIQYKAIKELLWEYRIFLGGDELGKVSPHYKDEQIIEIQKNISIESYCTFWGRSGLRLVSLGSFSYSNSVLPLTVSVGRYCSIGGGLQVLGDRHPLEWATTCPSLYAPNSGLVKTLVADTGRQTFFRTYDRTHKPVKVGNDVWIGQNVTLAQGITIGNGSVIAGNSMVTKDVPPYCIVGGNPAKIIRKRFSDTIIEALTSLQWWKYSIQDFSDLDITNPSIFCQQLSERIAKKNIAPFTPKILNYSEIKKFT